MPVRSLKKEQYIWVYILDYHNHIPFMTIVSFMKQHDEFRAAFKDWMFEDFADAYHDVLPWNIWRLQARRLKKSDLQRYHVEATFARWNKEAEAWCKSREGR